MAKEAEPFEFAWTALDQSLWLHALTAIKSRDLAKDTMVLDLSKCLKLQSSHSTPPEKVPQIYTNQANQLTDPNPLMTHALLAYRQCLGTKGRSWQPRAYFIPLASICFSKPCNAPGPPICLSTCVMYPTC